MNMRSKLRINITLGHLLSQRQKVSKDHDTPHGLPTSERYAKPHLLLILRVIPLYLALMRPHLDTAFSTRNMLIKFSGPGKELPKQPGSWGTSPARGCWGSGTAWPGAGMASGDPTAACWNLHRGYREDRARLFLQVHSRRRGTVTMWKRGCSELTKEKKFHCDDSQALELAKSSSSEVLETQLT